MSIKGEFMGVTMIDHIPGTKITDLKGMIVAESGIDYERAEERIKNQAQAKDANAVVCVQAFTRKPNDRDNDRTLGTFGKVDQVYGLIGNAVVVEPEDVSPQA